MGCLKLDLLEQECKSCEQKMFAVKNTLTSEKSKKNLRSVYLYGFNGIEKDDEISTGVYSADWREVDTRLGRWFSTDPLNAMAVYESPYSFCFNSPILLVDPEGLFPSFKKIVHDVKEFVKHPFDKKERSRYVNHKSQIDFPSFKDITRAIAGGIRSLANTLVGNNHHNPNLIPAGNYGLRSTIVVNVNNGPAQIQESNYTPERLTAISGVPRIKHITSVAGTIEGFAASDELRVFKSGLLDGRPTLLLMNNRAGGRLRTDNVLSNESFRHISFLKHADAYSIWVSKRGNPSSIWNYQANFRVHSWQPYTLGRNSANPRPWWHTFVY